MTLNRTPDRTLDDPFDFIGASNQRMAAVIRKMHWSATVLGVVDAWPQSLRSALSICLGSSFPIAIYWGPHLALIYNDDWSPILGSKHPVALGRPASEVWPEIWETIGPLFERVMTTGQATRSTDQLLAMHRHGFTEECYFDYTFSPIRSEGGAVGGIFNAVVETTFRVIGERRTHLLRDLTDAVGNADSAEEVCTAFASVLSRGQHDAPFALLYLLEGDALRRAASAGTKLPDSMAPSVIDPATDDRWQTAAVLQNAQAVRIEHLGRRFNARIPSGAWPEDCESAIVLPLAGINKKQPLGLLIAGVSPRLALDAEYEEFLDRLASTTASAIIRARTSARDRQRAEELARLDRAKTTFFSNVSHEFRTPLTLMLGPLEDLMARDDLANDVQTQMQLAQRNAMRLLKLVNSLLDFSRIEVGRVQASFEPTDLAAFTRDLASAFRSATERAGIELIVECPTLPESIYVDRDMWEKIVLNLLSNAFKYTLLGSIRVSLKQEAGAAALEVTDTGVGIPEQAIPRLFERFYRVEGVQGRTHEGTGIGLALVQELVRLHGGTLEARSVLGKGSTFTVRVPLGSAHLPEDQVRAFKTSGTPVGARAFVQEALRWLPEHTDTAASAPTAEPLVTDQRFSDTFGARIVLADDNADMRDYLRNILSRHYAVDAVADGRQALASIRQSRPDLLISDVMMPNVDGFGLVAALRADASLQDIPIVLISARAGEEARIEGLDAGADDYLVKPFSARELLARVGALLERERMHRTAQAVIATRTQQFEQLLTSAPVGVYLVDEHLRFKEVNPVAVAAFDEPSDLIGRDLAEVIGAVSPQDYTDDVVNIFRRTLQTGEPYYVSERVEPRKDGKAEDYYEWQVNRIPLSNDRFGAVCYFRNISSQVHARMALEEADRQKDEFLAMLAHELRNPLAPIRNAGEILSRVIPAESMAHPVVGMIKRQVNQLTRLVDDLMDVSRITRGRIELKREQVDLWQIINHAVESVEPLLRDKRHAIALTTESLSLPVKGDAVRLIQCVVNILTNAIKYTDAEGRINVRARTDGSFAVVQVSDTGEGIPAELLPRVFDLFVQSERTLDRSQGGLGIGLSVVKGLIEMHGGSVSAYSEGIGRGSLFEIRLPLLRDEEASAAKSQDAPLTSRRILVVDDNVDSANSLSALLALDGHQVEVAYRGSEALAKARTFHPEVALLDIGLPEMDGYELARRLKALPQLANTRLIALTGYGQPDDRERTISAGFDAHLVKPVELNALLSTLARLSRER